jgi:hypothetical protein
LTNPAPEVSENSADEFVTRRGLRRTIVVAENATDVLVTPNLRMWSQAPIPSIRIVAKALMVAFAMIMDNKVRERPTEVSLTQRYDSVQTLFLDRTHKPLRICIAIGSAKRCPNHVHT